MSSADWAPTPIPRTSTGFRRISVDDVAAFADLTGDRNPVHAGSHGVVHGLLGMGVGVGLLVAAGMLTEDEVALLAVEEWRFHKPLLVGEEVRARMEVLDSRPGRTRPGTALVRRRVELCDRAGEVVQSGQLVFFARRSTGR